MGDFLLGLLVIIGMTVSLLSAIALGIWLIALIPTEYLTALVAITIIAVPLWMERKGIYHALQDLGRIVRRG